MSGSRLKDGIRQGFETTTASCSNVAFVLLFGFIRWLNVFGLALAELLSRALTTFLIVSLLLPICALVLVSGLLLFGVFLFFLLAVATKITRLCIRKIAGALDWLGRRMGFGAKPETGGERWSPFPVGLALIGLAVVVWTDRDSYHPSLLFWGSFLTLATLALLLGLVVLMGIWRSTDPPRGWPARGRKFVRIMETGGVAVIIAIGSVMTRMIKACFAIGDVTTDLYRWAAYLVFGLLGILWLLLLTLIVAGRTPPWLATLLVMSLIVAGAFFCIRDWSLASGGGQLALAIVFFVGGMLSRRIQAAGVILAK